MKRLTAIALLLACAPAPGARAATPAIDTALAARYFAEAREIVRRDAGALWGRSLDGPLMFFEPATRRVVASAPDREGRLAAEADVFTGTLPPGRRGARSAAPARRPRP